MWYPELISYSTNQELLWDRSIIRDLKERASFEELEAITREDFHTDKGWEEFQREWSFNKRRAKSSFVNEYYKIINKYEQHGVRKQK